MYAVQKIIREKYAFSILIAAVAGLVLYYGFALAYVKLMPWSLSIAREFVDPNSDLAWGGIAALNIVHATTHSWCLVIGCRSAHA
jgi:hypothetical protein